MQMNSYQGLKSSLFSALYEDKDTLFYHLYEKRLHRKDNNKKRLLDILDAAGSVMSFYDIVYRLIEEDDADTLFELTLSERVSSSKKAILCGYDSCLTCKKSTSCREGLHALSPPDRVNYLMYLRFVRAGATLKMLKCGSLASHFKVLLREPILMKFLANYALVVDVKNELKRDGAIKGHKTLYKGAGKYCPFDDLYQKNDT